MRASLPLKKGAAPTGFESTRKSLNQLERDMGQQVGGYICSWSLGAEE